MRNRRKFAGLEEELKRSNATITDLMEEIDAKAAPLEDILFDLSKIFRRYSERFENFYHTLAQGEFEDLGDMIDRVQTQLAKFQVFLEGKLGRVTSINKELDPLWQDLMEAEYRLNRLSEERKRLKQTPEAVDYLRSTDEY
jgi:chromosome segregation ATPase